MKNQNRKLALRTDTLRQLTGAQLGGIGGGGTELCPATNFCPLVTAGCTQEKTGCPAPTPTAGCTTHS